MLVSLHGGRQSNRSLKAYILSSWLFQQSTESRIADALSENSIELLHLEVKHSFHLILLEPTDSEILTCAFPSGTLILITKWFVEPAVLLPRSHEGRVASEKRRKGLGSNSQHG